MFAVLSAFVSHSVRGFDGMAWHLAVFVFVKLTDDGDMHINLLSESLQINHVFSVDPMTKSDTGITLCGTECVQSNEDEN